jgi:hypothetical protein
MPTQDTNQTLFVWNQALNPDPKALEEPNPVSELPKHP